MKNNEDSSLENQLKVIINEQTSKVLTKNDLSDTDNEIYTKGYKDATFDLTGKIDKLLSYNDENISKKSDTNDDSKSSDSNIIISSDDTDNSNVLDALIKQISSLDDSDEDSTKSSPLDLLGSSTASLYLIHINLYDNQGHEYTVSQYTDSNSYDDIQYYCNNILEYTEKSNFISDQITGCTLVSLKNIIKVKLILDPHKYTAKKNGRLDVSTKDDQESLLLYRDEDVIKELL